MADQQTQEQRFHQARTLAGTLRERCQELCGRYIAATDQLSHYERALSGEVPIVLNVGHPGAFGEPLNGIQLPDHVTNELLSAHVDQLRRRVEFYEEKLNELFAKIEEILYAAER